MDSIAFRFSSMTDWIRSITSSSSFLGIPPTDQHKFQIFATVACDILWFYRNKAFHDGASFDARFVSRHINKITIEPYQAWHSFSPIQVEKWMLPLLN
jgi:hypothetical protein